MSLRALPLCCLLACGTSAKDTITDTDQDTDPAKVDTDRVDSDGVWDTGFDDTDGAAGSFGDPNIGATPLDGTWTGTFEIRNVVPLFNGTPKCLGDVTFVIDGTAYRHVNVEIACAQWDPNFTALGAIGHYGALDGIGVATLNTEDFSTVALQLFVRAPNMGDFDKSGIMATIDGDTLTVSYNDISGAGAFREGVRIDITATRQAE